MPKQLQDLMVASKS